MSSTSLRDRFDRRHLLAFTTALTIVLIALGVNTAAKGAGLSCQQQWPTCDGGLIPQTVPSFIEWLHRFVAGIAGFFILGSAYEGWKTGDRRIRAALGVALVVLPVQILLGRETVQSAGYTPFVHALHILAALTIFTGLALATVWLYERADLPPLDRIAGASLAALVLSLPFARGLGITHDPNAQAVYYGLVVAAYGGVVATAVQARRLGSIVLASVSFVTAGVLVAQLVLARDVLLHTGLVELLYYVSVVGSLLLVGAVMVLTRADDSGRRRTGSASRVD